MSLQLQHLCSPTLASHWINYLDCWHLDQLTFTALYGFTHLYHCDCSPGGTFHTRFRLRVAACSKEITATLTYIHFNCAPHICWLTFFHAKWLPALQLFYVDNVLCGQYASSVLI